MWAVVEVSDGYPHWGCSAESVWLFDTEDAAEAWVLSSNCADDLFILRVSGVQVSDVES